MSATIRISLWLKERLEEIKKEKGHLSFDSVIRSLLFVYEMKPYHKPAESTVRSHKVKCPECGRIYRIKHRKHYSSHSHKALHKLVPIKRK